MWEVSVDFLLPFGVVSGCGAGLAYKLVARLTRIAAGVSWLLATAMFAAFAGRYCQEQCAIPHIREKYCPPPPDAVDDLGTDDMS